MGSLQQKTGTVGIGVFPEKGCELDSVSLPNSSTPWLLQK
jgi:hypothetical protein